MLWDDGASGPCLELKKSCTFLSWFLLLEPCLHWPQETHIHHLNFHRSASPQPAKSGVIQQTHTVNKIAWLLLGAMCFVDCAPLLWKRKLETMMLGFRNLWLWRGTCIRGDWTWQVRVLVLQLRFLSKTLWPKEAQRGKGGKRVDVAYTFRWQATVEELKREFEAVIIRKDCLLALSLAHVWWALLYSSGLPTHETAFSAVVWGCLHLSTINITPHRLPTEKPNKVISHLRLLLGDSRLCYVDR